MSDDKIVPLRREQGKVIKARDPETGADVWLVSATYDGTEMIMELIIRLSGKQSKPRRIAVMGDGQVDGY